MAPPRTRVIPVDEYPALLRPADARALVETLKSEKTERRATRIIASRREEFRAAVLSYVADLEKAAAKRDTARLYACAHEIRGMAETVGLAATGRIANGLCLYLDAMAGRDRPPDATTMRLHVDAIARAAQAGQAADSLGEIVAGALAALVTRTLERADAAPPALTVR